MPDALLIEARQDIKDIKESLASIDKNTAISAERIEALHIKTEVLERRVDVIDNHVKFVNSVFKMATICGSITLFFVELIPVIEKLFR